MDWDELIIQDAEKNKTTRELVATVKNTDSRIIWFSSDKKVAEVTNDYSGNTDCVRDSLMMKKRSYLHVSFTVFQYFIPFFFTRLH